MRILIKNVVLNYLLEIILSTEYIHAFYWKQKAIQTKIITLFLLFLKTVLF
jgi:hypothetical protein